MDIDTIIFSALAIVIIALLIAILFRTFASKPQDQQEQQNITAELADTREQNAALQSEIQSTKSQLKDTETQRNNLQEQVTSLTAKVSSLNTELENEQQKLTDRNDLQKLFGDQFKTMSTETLENQEDQFIKRAEKTLKPIYESLYEKVGDLNRTSGKFEGQIETLRKDTQTLTSALTKQPQARGQWAEMLVERALELAGLEKGSHYKTQESDNKGGRTDFIVHMPHERDIILDSKVSLPALKDAHETTDENLRNQHLDKHARQMQDHVKRLAKKEYWKNLPETADFVVMVVPEFALSPAFERHPDIFDDALGKKVVIATHSTLVALLKTVAVGWQQRNLAKQADEIGILGRELHDRLQTFASYYADIGKSLDRAVDRYNSGVGSLEGRVLPQARRFTELGVQTTKEISETPPIDTSVRPLKSSTTNNHHHTNNQLPQHTTKTSHTPSTSDN